jgi:hypothetical protein
MNPQGPDTTAHRRHHASIGKVANNTLALKFGVVKLFHGSIKSVHVEVKNYRVLTSSTIVMTEQG